MKLQKNNFFYKTLLFAFKNDYLCKKNTMGKNCLNCKNKAIKLFEGVYCTLNNLLIGKEILACSKFEECENLFQYKVENSCDIQLNGDTKNKVEVEYKVEKKIDLFKNIELT